MNNLEIDSKKKIRGAFYFVKGEVISTEKKMVWDRKRKNFGDVYWAIKCAGKTVRLFEKEVSNGQKDIQYFLEDGNLVGKYVMFTTFSKFSHVLKFEVQQGVVQSPIEDRSLEKYLKFVNEPILKRTGRIIVYLVTNLLLLFLLSYFWNVDWLENPPKIPRSFIASYLFLITMILGGALHAKDLEYYEQRK